MILLYKIVHGRKGETISFEWTLDMARKDNNEKAVQELEAINFADGVYQNGMEEKHIEREWLWFYHGFLYRMSMNEMYHYLAKATEYNLIDKIDCIRGIDFSEESIGEEWLNQLAFDQEIKVLKTPVYFMGGKYDYNVPSELVKAFNETVIAPDKEYIEFKYSAHSPNYEEPNKFYNEMVRIKEKVIGKNPE